MTFSTRALVMIGWLAAVGPAAEAQTYTLNDGYSTTSNQSSDLWSYWKSGTQLLDSHQTITWSQVHGTYSYQGWAKSPYYSGGQSPTIGRLGGQVVGRPGWTNCVGGCQEYLEIRFLCPKAGTVNVTARLSDLEPTPGCFAVPSSAAFQGDWGGGTIPAAGSTGVLQPAPKVVSAGQVLSFRISPGNGCDWHDLTAIELAVSYDGATELDGLSGTTDSVPLAAGGVVEFALAAGPAFGGKNYLILGSVSGTSPGLPTAGGVLPLNPDAWFDWTALNPNSPLLPQSIGILNNNGLAQAAFVVPPTNNPALVGLEFHYAYLVHNGFGAIEETSNAVKVTLDP